MTAKKADGAEEYNASEIQVLEGLEPVRKRPGMYIGSTGYDGLHHCLKEIADNSIDEAIAGYATSVTVTILADGVSLYESLLSKALDLAKGGKSTSDVAEEWLGEGVSMESVERMGRSFRNALKNA